MTSPMTCACGLRQRVPAVAAAGRNIAAGPGAPYQALGELEIGSTLINTATALSAVRSPYTVSCCLTIFSFGAPADRCIC
jgi:hypothetical protein